MSYNVVLFHFVILICSCSCDLSCSDKRSQKSKDYKSTRRNFLAFNSTTMSCQINYFDVESISNATFNVFHNDESFKLLKKLDLSWNGISEIRPDTFNQFMSLENLKIANNFLIQIENHYFSNVGSAGRLRELCILDLSSNLIQNIDEMSFRSLESLLWLNLADNCLMTLTPYLPIPALDTLNLSWNFIEAFPHLRDLIAIHTLDLSHNTQNILNSTKSFSSRAIRTLKSLNIANNRLSNLHQLQFFPNLVELNIASNPIEFDENFHFAISSDRMRYLRKLNLTSTNLTTTDSIMGRLNCNQLIALSIDRNPIETDFLDFPMMKCSFTNLQHLRFSQRTCRKFENFYHRIKLNFPQLRRVEIEYDEANCNCAMENHEIFSYFHIQYSVNWSHMCSKGQHSAIIVRETYRLWLISLLILRLIAFLG